MPRKSTTSISGPSDLGTMSAPVPADHEGDTSMLSVATDASPSSKQPRSSTKAEKGDTDSMGIDDLLLPRTLTSRLARGTLPANTSIQKDALLALTKAASVFISYLASTANDMTTKKTIGPQDVLKALQEIEMAQVMGLGAVGEDGKVGGRLERELEVWETVVRGKRKGYREKVKQRESGLGTTGDGDESQIQNEEEGGEREAKRARIEGDGVEDTSHENGTASFAGQQSHSDALNHTPGRAVPDDMQDELDDEAYDEDGNGDGDETQPEDNEEEEPDEEEEEPPRDEDELNGYGPDDQLRHDMNGDESGEESD